MVWVGNKTIFEILLICQRLESSKPDSKYTCVKYNVCTLISVKLNAHFYTMQPVHNAAKGLCVLLTIWTYFTLLLQIWKQQVV